MDFYLELEGATFTMTTKEGTLLCTFTNLSDAIQAWFDRGFRGYLYCDGVRIR